MCVADSLLRISDVLLKLYYFQIKQLVCNDLFCSFCVQCADEFQLLEAILNEHCTHAVEVRVILSCEITHVGFYPAIGLHTGIPIVETRFLGEECRRWNNVHLTAYDCPIHRSIGLDVCRHTLSRMRCNQLQTARTLLQ